MKKKEESKKSKIIMSIFIAFIMVTSVIGFMFQYTKQRYRFGKYQFIRTEQGFSIVVNKQEVYFDYFPTEANISDFDQNIDSRVKNTKMFYLTYEFNTSHAQTLGKVAYDLTLTLDRFGIFVQPAFTQNTSFNVPIITCANATISVPVLYFKESNQTSAYLKANCIILEGDSDIDFVRLKDRLLYGFFGVLP